jgi:osmotically inducible protein OsmC
MPTRNATAEWQGGMKSGKGSLRSESGAIAADYNFSGRFENGGGTNPEELLAASHAGCYSMALSGNLERAGKTPTKIVTDAACSVEKVENGFKVTKMHLVVRATVPGIQDDEFQKIAAATKEGCPISGVMKNNVAVTLDARLA